MIEVTAENYYSKEVNKQYMSFHTWLSLHGCDGIIPCEEKAALFVARFPQGHNLWLYLKEGGKEKKERHTKK